MLVFIIPQVATPANITILKERKNNKMTQPPQRIHNHEIDSKVCDSRFDGSHIRFPYKCDDSADF